MKSLHAPQTICRKECPPTSAADFSQVERADNNTEPLGQAIGSSASTWVRSTGVRALSSRTEAVTREERLNQVWGLEAPPPTRTVDNPTAGLRAKLERDTAEPRLLLTVRGVGYKWVP